MAKNKDAKVRLGADTTAFTREMKKASGSVHSFSKDVGGITGSLNSGFMALGKSLGGIFAAGAILSGMKNVYMAFEEQEKANRRLMFAVNGNQTAFKELNAQATKLQSQTGVSDDAIMQIQMLAVSSGKSVTEVKKLVTASLALSAATGTDLQGAYMQISGTLNGIKGKLIPKLGEEFAKLSIEQLKNGDVVDLLIKKHGDLAAKSASETEKLAANWDEVKERAGGAIANVINPVLKKMNEYLEKMNDDTKTVKDAMGETIKVNPFKFSSAKEQLDFIEQQKLKTKELADAQGRVAALDERIFQIRANIAKIPSDEEIRKKLAEDEAAALEEKRKKEAEYAKQRDASFKQYQAEWDKWEEQQELDAILIDDKRKRMEELNTEFSRMVQLMTETRKPVFLPGVSDEEGVSDTPGIDTEKIFKTYQDNIEAAKNFTNDMNMILSGGLQEAGMVGAEAFADMLTGDGSPEDMFKAILDVFATFLKQMGAAILSYGIAMSAFKKAFTNPLAAIAAGIGLIVAGGVVSNLAQRGPKAQGMADGGIVPMGYPNDTYPAMLTSGERVIPPGKLGGLGEMITVTGVLRAGDLYISSERGKYLNNRKG